MWKIGKTLSIAQNSRCLVIVTHDEQSKEGREQHRNYKVNTIYDATLAPNWMNSPPVPAQCVMIIMWRLASAKILFSENKFMMFSCRFFFIKVYYYIYFSPCLALAWLAGREVCVCAVHTFLFTWLQFEILIQRWVGRAGFGARLHINLKDTRLPAPTATNNKNTEKPTITTISNYFGHVITLNSVSQWIEFFSEESLWVCLCRMRYTK